MSVLITIRIPGDVNAFRAALDQRSAEFVEVSSRGRSAGAVHHRFGLTDGAVLVVDEWDSPDSFEKFFADPDMQKFVASVGGDVSTPPEITVAEALTTPDQF